MIEIDKNIIIETEHMGSNNAIITTPEGVVLIDSPHRPSDAIKWRRLAESCGEVIYLFNTDHHIDHTMGNHFLPGTVVSHSGTRERLLNNPPSPEYISDLLDVIDPAGKMYMEGHRQRPPTITYTDRMDVHLGGLTFEFQHFRGHTLNSSVIYLKQQKIAFVGDLVCEAGLPAFIEADTFDWIDTVKHIEGMDIRYIVPGHGKVCGIETATWFRKEIETLVDRVSQAIDQNYTRDQVMAEVEYEDHIHIATGDSPAYPDYLMDRFMRGSVGIIHDHVLQRRAAETHAA